MSKVTKETSKGKSSRFIIFLWAILSSMVFVPASRSTIAAPQPFTHRLVNANIGMEPRRIDTCIGRMKAAASLGYNGYIVTNNEDHYLEDASQAYLNNMQRAVSEAKKLGIALIPRHFHVLDIAQEDFNLSEAFPVRNTKFKVVNGEARVISDHVTGFKNGDFESYTGGKPDGWQISNASGAVIQTTGTKSGSACLRIAGGGKYAHIKQHVTLKPFRAYRLRVWVSTKNFNQWRAARFCVGAGGKTLLARDMPFGTPLDHRNRGIWTTLSSTHGWRLCQNDFNSLSSTSAEIKFVVSWPGREQVGIIWLDDMRLEEVGLFETVRRNSCPITVTSEDGSKIYKEGSDYVVDPRCDKFTVESFWYQGHLEIPGGSTIQNGQELRVNWYQMGDVESRNPVTSYCPSKTWDALRDNVKKMDAIYEQDDWMYVGLSEWRVSFWDNQCEMFPKAQNAGEYMAATLQATNALLGEANLCRELFVVSDMYDPYHNVYWPTYQLSNGNVQSSWHNMDTNVVIIQWNACGMPWYEKSLRFYMGLDDSLNPDGKVYRQVLNVLDGGRVGTWLNSVEKAEKEGGRGVVGIFYTDWSANFSQMAAVKTACVARGRWGSGPLPKLLGTRCRDSVAINLQTKSITGTDKLSVLPRSNKAFNVRFHIGQNANISLAVRDVMGREVGSIAAGNKKMGTHEIAWNAAALPAGVYFLRLTIDGAAQRSVKQIIF